MQIGSAITTITFGQDKTVKKPETNVLLGNKLEVDDQQNNCGEKVNGKAKANIDWTPKKGSIISSAAIVLVV